MPWKFASIGLGKGLQVSQLEEFMVLLYQLFLWTLVCHAFSELVFFIVFVKKHNMHIEPKSWKLKLLGKLIVQHGIRLHFLYLFEFKFCLSIGIWIQILFVPPPVGMGPHMREFKLKLLGKLVVQRFWIVGMQKGIVRLLLLKLHIFLVKWFGSVCTTPLFFRALGANMDMIHYFLKGLAQICFNIYIISNDSSLMLPISWEISSLFMWCSSEICQQFEHLFMFI